MGHNKPNKRGTNVLNVTRILHCTVEPPFTDAVEETSYAKEMALGCVNSATLPPPAEEVNSQRNLGEPLFPHTLYWKNVIPAMTA